MESLELTVRRLQDSIMKIFQVSTRPSPVRGSRGGQGGEGGQGDQEGHRENNILKQTAAQAPLIVLIEAHNKSDDDSFAAVAARSTRLPQQAMAGRQVQAQSNHQGKGPVLTPQGQVLVRGRSPSVKRPRQGDWITVEGQNVKKTKKPLRKTEVGTSTVDFSDFGGAAQAGPLQYYIGNTTAKADENTIKAILIKSANSLDKDVQFEVLNVHILTKETNPRS